MGLIPGKVGELGSTVFDFGFGSFSSFVPYIIYILVFLFLGAIAFGVFHFLKFNFPVDVYHLYGSGESKKLSVGKKKYNRFKWNKSKTSWIPMLPLFTRKEVEPFDAKYIYPGNRLIAFKLGDQYLPGCLDIDVNEDGVLNQINPVPHYIRNWQSMEHKKNAEEFAKKGFWEENKYFIMIMVTVAFCVTGTCLMVYMTYRYAAGGRIDTAAINGLTETLKGLTTISGVAP